MSRRLTHEEKLDRISDRIGKEMDKFKAKMIAQGAEYVFNSAYSINIAREAEYLLTDCIGSNFDDEDNSCVPVIYDLTKRGVFIKELLRWAVNQDAIGVGNTEETYNMVCDFCVDAKGWVDKKGGGPV